MLLGTDLSVALTALWGHGNRSMNGLRTSKLTMIWSNFPGVGFLPAKPTGVVRGWGEVAEDNVILSNHEDLDFSAFNNLGFLMPWSL